MPRSFTAPNSYHRFTRHVRAGARYLHDEQSREFLAILLEQTRKRTQRIKQGAIFWRAQLGYDIEPYCQEGEYIDDLPCPLPPNRMKPLADRAREGRANPRGIPCLYGSNRKDTAIAEVRPWLASLVSVAQFRTRRELEVVNCLTDVRPKIYLFKGAPKREWNKCVWWDIDQAFSRPVTLSDDTADYVPTQIIAELFKVNRFDGIAYRSAFGGGYNLALFDLDSADLINCGLYEVREVNLESKEVCNPYFVTAKEKKESA